MSTINTDVLEGIRLNPAVKRYLEKEKHETIVIKDPFGVPQKPLPVNDHVKQLTTISRPLLSSEVIQDGLKWATVAVGAVGLYPPAAVPAAKAAVMVGVGILFSERENNWSADNVAMMNKLFKSSHDAAYDDGRNYSGPKLEEKHQRLGSMVKHASLWAQAVVRERQYEKNYKALQREASMGSEISMWDKPIRPPDNKILDSAEGISEEEMEKNVMMLVGAWRGVGCRIAKSQRIFPAQADRCYKGRVVDVVKDKGIVLQRVYSCGPTPTEKDFVLVKHRLSDVKDIGKDWKGQEYCISYDINRVAYVEQIELSHEKCNNHHCIE